MKFFYLLIFVAISAAAGYFTEPSFRLQLTGKSPNAEKAKAPVVSVSADPMTPNAVVPETPSAAGTTPEVAEVETPESPFETIVPSGSEVAVAPAQPEVTAPKSSGQKVNVVSLMKASLASGQISKFSAAQVLEWKAGASPEIIDGETYQVGNVIFQAETPFGTKKLPAKALIQDGKVVRWISPKSGMQIE